MNIGVAMIFFLRKMYVDEFLKEVHCSLYFWQLLKKIILYFHNFLIVVEN